MSDEDVPELELPILNTVAPAHSVDLTDVTGEIDAITPAGWGGSAGLPSSTSLTGLTDRAGSANPVDMVIPAGPVAPAEPVAPVGPNAGSSPFPMRVDVGTGDDSRDAMPSMPVVSSDAGVDDPHRFSGDQAAPSSAASSEPLPDVTAEPPATTMEMAATVAYFSESSEPAPPQIPLAPMKRMQARFNPLADVLVYVVVFAGGFVGTAMRYGLNLLLPATPAASGFWGAFHLPTFAANMIACFMFAALTSYLSQASWIRKRIRQLTSRGVGMGMCGGFSTLSAMVIEELTSFRQGQVGGFLCYMLASFVGGLIVAWVGTYLGLGLAAKRSVRSIRETLQYPGPSVAASAPPAGDYGQPLTAVGGAGGAVDGGGVAPNAAVPYGAVGVAGDAAHLAAAAPAPESAMPGFAVATAGALAADALTAGVASPSGADAALASGPMEPFARPGTEMLGKTPSAAMPNAVSTLVPSPAAGSYAPPSDGAPRVGQSVPILGETTLVPSFEPDPVTDEIPLVADPIRGEARER